MPNPHIPFSISNRFNTTIKLLIFTFLFTTSTTFSSPQVNPANWGLDRIDQRSASLDNTYTPLNDAAGIVIYVLDTPIYPEHSEFGGRVERQLYIEETVSCSSGGGSGDPGDTSPHTTSVNGSSHGTHIAAIAAGATYGVAKQATIIGVEALRDCGNVAKGNIAMLIEAIDKMIFDKNLNFNGELAIANISISANSLDNDLNTKIDEALANNIIVVLSADNDNTNACDFSPQSRGGPNSAAIVVGAIDETSQKWQYSNHGDCVDIYAPGTNITSAISDDVNASGAGSGTSMSAPFVVG